MCDDNFCSLWSAETSHLKEALLSCIGFVIDYAGFPIIWRNVLQAEIALSTCESKYILLRTCLRSLVPLRCILDELCAFRPPPGAPLSLLPTQAPTQVLDCRLCCQLQSLVYEDNQGALEIANQEAQYRPLLFSCAKMPGFWFPLGPPIKWRTSSQNPLPGQFLRSFG